MISYREKQLLAAMKYSQSETDSLIEDMKKALEQTEHGETIELEKTEESFDAPQDMEQLYERAKAAGYDSWTRASDILSPEELADLKSRKKQIEAEFKDKVKLQKVDYAFLIPAVLLQLGKQILFKLNFDPHSESASVTDDEFHDKWTGPITRERLAGKYYAPFQQIIKSPGVPYDFTGNTAHFSISGQPTYLGLGGTTHRFKSVGHDPVLGLLFGTSNILTNTGTFYLDKAKLLKAKENPYANLFLGTVHVGYSNPALYTGPYISAPAATNIMLAKAVERYKNEPDAVHFALLKTIEHIQSDQESPEGIPIPFVSAIMGSKEARRWAHEGLDWDHFSKNAIIVGKQIAATVLINFIISSLHKLYLMWGDIKGADNIIEAVRLYVTEKPAELDYIRTKKIIMYSNAIASTVNLAVCIGGGVISANAGNAELSKEFFSHLDIGGLMVTLFSLFHDGTYILKVKDDFIKSTINTDFDRRMIEIEQGGALEMI